MKLLRVTLSGVVNPTTVPLLEIPLIVVPPCSASARRKFCELVAAKN